MNGDALESTLDTGRVTFWSRSRGELWEKGETSGNTLELVEIAADCDNDAILVLARPSGPTCHTGTVSCWPVGTQHWDEREPGFARLERLWRVIGERARERPAGSYTTRLLEEGPDLPARKVVEEATEVLMAAKDHAGGAADGARLAEEVADLVYHLLVLLRERGVDPAEVLDELGRREAPGEGARA
jgi:phosphoribosyl-AMP cyclohydrolase / phosphoribosyl-ATP pyrophosphohydrolase